MISLPKQFEDLYCGTSPLSKKFQMLVNKHDRKDGSFEYAYGDLDTLRAVLRSIDVSKVNDVLFLRLYKRFEKCATSERRISFGNASYYLVLSAYYMDLLNEDQINEVIFGFDVADYDY